MKGQAVGVVEDSEEPIEGAGAATAPTAEGAGAGREARAVRLRPVDLDDPVWAPIEGITLDRYAQLTAALARDDLGRSDRTQAWLESEGVAPGTWGQVQAGWVNRMSKNEAVRTRYGVLYAQA